MSKIRVVIDSHAGDGFHELSCYWIEESRVDEKIQEMLERIGDLLVVEDEPVILDGSYATEVNDMMTGNNGWTSGALPPNCVVVKLYRIQHTEY